MTKQPMQNETQKAQKIKEKENGNRQTGFSFSEENVGLLPFCVGRLWQHQLGT